MMPTGWIDGERAVASRILLSLTTRLPRLRHRPPTLRRLLKFLQAHLVGDAIRCAIGDECKVVRGRMELASLCLFSQLLASNPLRGTSLYRGLDPLDPGRSSPRAVAARRAHTSGRLQTTWRSPR